MTTGERVKVAIIGAGAMAREHVRAFQDVPGVLIAGIHSRTRSRAEGLAAEFGIGSVHDSVDRLYAATEADLVVVAVPELAASEVALACFKYPWTVLLEKPPGYNLDDARLISDAAARSGRRVFVGLNRRFLASTRAVMQDLAAEPGPRVIVVHDRQSLSEARTAGHPEPVVENWMYANSVHVIDYLRVFGRGDVLSVRPISCWGDLTGLVSAKVSFASGDVGLYLGIWSGPGPWAVTVQTARRRWDMRPLERASLYRGPRSRPRIVPRSEWDRTFKPGFRLQAEHAVRGLRGPSDITSLDDAMRTMELIHSIFSARC